MVSFLGENMLITGGRNLRGGGAGLACSFPAVDGGESLGWWSFDGFWLGVEMAVARGRKE